MLAGELARNAYRAGRAALMARDYGLARAALRWARRADSGNPLYIHAEAELAHRTGAYHEAERLYRRLEDLAERTFGRGHARVVAIRARLIALYRDMGRPEQATRLRLQTVAGLDRRTAADAGMPALQRLAELCLDAGRTDIAMELFEAALARRRSVFPDRHERVIECLSGLARLRRRIGRIALAAAARETDPAFRAELAWHGVEAGAVAWQA